jgi:hypothetical protein
MGGIALGWEEGEEEEGYEEGGFPGAWTGKGWELWRSGTYPGTASPKPHCAPQSCCGERGAGSERPELSMDGSSVGAVGAVGCGRGEGYGNLAPQAEIHSRLRRKRESAVRSR